MNKSIITHNEMFDKMEKIKYNRKVTGTDSRVWEAKGSHMRKVRAPQGKDNG